MHYIFCVWESVQTDLGECFVGLRRVNHSKGYKAVICEGGFCVELFVFVIFNWLLEGTSLLLILALTPELDDHALHPLSLYKQSLGALIS